MMYLRLVRFAAQPFFFSFFFERINTQNYNSADFLGVPSVEESHTQRQRVDFTWRFDMLVAEIGGFEPSREFVDKFAAEHR